MRQAVMTAPGVIEIREVEPPTPARGEALIGVRRIGVCGSDIHVWHGKHPYTSYPVVQGHEFSGVVEAVGDDVSGVKPGQKVTALPQVVCGECEPCRRGDYHICDDLKVCGFQAPGCAREFFPIDAGKVVPLPEAFTFEQGAMVEPTAVAVHAAGRAGPLDGRNVAILGAGPIGNLVAQVARARGARVLLTDLSDWRLATARRCGLTEAFNPGDVTLKEARSLTFGRRGIDVVFECVGAAQTLSAAIEAIARGGTIVVVGVFGEKPRADVGLVQDRELTVRGTLMYKHEDYLDAVSLIAEGKVKTEPLESRHFPLTDYAGAYGYIDDHRTECMKVFIDL